MAIGFSPSTAIGSPHWWPSFLPKGSRRALATGGIMAASGADVSGLPDTRMQSMGYSSSRWV
jgi:hypothetical protein